MVHSVVYCDGNVSIKSIDIHEPIEQHRREESTQSANNQTTNLNPNLLFQRRASDGTSLPSTHSHQLNRKLSKFREEHASLNSFKKTIKKSVNKMNRRHSLKRQTTIEGYLEILDSDEVELRSPQRLKLYRRQVGEDGDEELLIDRPFSCPPKVHMSSVTPVDSDDNVNPVKRDSFLRQSYNTIRKSLRLKNQRKGKSVDDTLTDKLHNGKANDRNNNNKSIQFEKLENVTTSDEGLNGTKIKKIGKHFRNSSLGSYFTFR